MAESKGKKMESGGKEVQRGTQDELEILRIIINQNPSLRQHVLEKIRQTKFRVGADKKQPEAPVAANAAKK